LVGQEIYVVFTERQGETRRDSETRMQGDEEDDEISNATRARRVGRDFWGQALDCA
jgi:hypothetical protein